MFRCWIGMTCCLLAVAFPHALIARDLPKTDPDRKAILDAARSEPSEKIVVKDLIRDGDFAWLCALKTDVSGALYRTDESIEIYFTVLHKEAGTWEALPVGGSFAETPAQVDCRWSSAHSEMSPKLPQSAEDIRVIWRQVIKADWLDSLAWGKLPTITPALQSALRQGLLVDVSAETSKEALSSTQIQMMQERCKKQKTCLDKTQQAIQKLAMYRVDERVSAVVWNNCRYGLRLFNPIPIEQCVSSQFHNNACKPGQYVLKDRAQLVQCIDAIHEQCKQDIKDPQARSLACAW